MSREIVEAVRGLAAEKNISSEKLMEALEDALLSAYKKTPEAARYAKVEMDRSTGQILTNNNISMDEAFRGSVARPPSPLPPAAPAQ